MKKIILASVILLALLSGCTQPNNNNDGEQCAQVITPAISPQDECTEFATPCDVPEGYTLTDSCEQAPNEPVPEDEVCAQVIISAVSPSGECREYPTPCDVPEGYTIADSCEEDAAEAKFEFDSNMLFCEYSGLLQKYSFAYQIRNQTDNAPTYGSKVWMKFSTGEGQGKTVQNTYKNGQVMWEEQQVSYLGNSYRGQLWEVRNAPYESRQFELIYCEPEFAEEQNCTAENGILIDSGNTEENCRAEGQVE